MTAQPLVPAILMAGRLTSPRTSVESLSITMSCGVVVSDVALGLAFVRHTVPSGPSSIFGWSVGLVPPYARTLIMYC